MNRRLVYTLLLLVSCAQAERRVAIVIDTSGSMLTNDRPRYTVQLAKIIADLQSPSDQLTVTRLPLYEASCSVGPNPSLQIRAQMGDRRGFQQSLEKLIEYGGENYFAATIRNAIQALGSDPKTERLLLMIADSGGLDTCDAVLTRELVALHQSGAMIAAINIGSTTGAFETNPAFDFRTPATDSEQLVHAVAEVYQHFFGGQRVQTGRVAGGRVQVHVDPYVRTAFLVVAADGPLEPFHEEGSNPSRASIDLDYLGGGQTIGLDRTARGYRIIRIQDPQEGTWSFASKGLSATAGFMLVQDYSLNVRLTHSSDLLEGIPTPVEVEIFDERTGKRVQDPNVLQKLQLTIEMDGQRVQFSDDGRNGDKSANDGILTGTLTAQGSGKKQLRGNVRNEWLNRSFSLDVQSIHAGWRVDPLTPTRVPYAQMTIISAKLERIGPAAVKPPEKVLVQVGGQSIELNDAGQNGDAQAGDGIFSGPWTPATMGQQTLHYSSPDSSLAARDQDVEVVGRIDLATRAAIIFGSLHSNSEAGSSLDLTASRVTGWVDGDVSTNFTSEGAALEIDDGSGWKSLGKKPVRVRISEEARSWPLRLRIGNCPASSAPGKASPIELKIVDFAGKTHSISVPVQVEIVPDPWLHCWWPVLAFTFAVLFTIFVFCGFWLPSRFAPRTGVMLSPEEDIDGEGFFYTIRAQPGSRSGFYRDATVYINQDFRISHRSANALAKLRAKRKTIRLSGCPGNTLWRQNASGEWEEVSTEETIARPGVKYRNEEKSLYFEIRNK